MKRHIYKLILITFVFILTGCFRWDNMDNIEIVTTIYPVEYITKTLYGKHSLVVSMYPDDTNIDKHLFTEKQINDFSKKDLLIYLGLSNDSDTTIKLLNKNKKIKIIDATHGMEKIYGNEEIWLNPSNFLMVAKNIKAGLEEYITTNYLIDEINENYDKLKISLSELDAHLKITAEKANYKTIIVNNNSLKFLSKYGLEIISIEENNQLTEKTVLDVIEMINNNNIKYIYMLQFDEESETIKHIKEKTNVNILTIKRLSSITDEERNNKKDYLTIMNENIDAIKLELYK